MITGYDNPKENIRKKTLPFIKDKIRIEITIKL
jgi:hypothetical protein